MRQTVILIYLLLSCTISAAAKLVTPDQPILQQPADGQQGYEFPFFVWNVVADTQGDNIVYDFYLGTDPAALPLRQEGLYDNFENADMIAFIAGNEFQLLFFNPLSPAKYYWKVVARNSHGETSTSAVYSFTAVSPNDSAPTEPVEPAPLSLATGVKLFPLLTWKKSTDNDGDSVFYDLYVGTAPQSARQVASDLTIPRFQLTNALKGNTKYYWQVIAKDGRGMQTNGSIWSFTTANTPPPAPLLAAPAAGETGTDYNITLKWLPVSDPDQDAVQYEVWYGTTATPTAFGTVKTTEVSLNLQSNTLYYWYVVAVDSRGSKTASQTRTFTTRSEGGNHAPAPVVLTAPVNNGTGISFPPELQWSAATDADGDPIVYNVYLGESQTELRLLSARLQTTTFKPVGLGPAKKYYWYVQADDGKGGITPSPIGTFTTTTDDVAITNITAYYRYKHDTQLFQFSNVAMTPSFSVDSAAYTIKGRTTVTNAVALAFYYSNPATAITIDLPAGFTATKNIIYNLGLPTNAQAIYQIEGPFANTIPAVVHLKAGIAERTYTVNIKINELPSRPILLAPADKEENVSVKPVFTWQDGNDPDGTLTITRVHLGTSQAGMIPYPVPANAKTLTYNGRELLNGVRYFWKVVVQDAQGESAESDLHWFITEKSAVLTAPVPTYPRLVTTYADTDFELEWQYDPSKSATYDVFLDVQPTPAKIAENITATHYPLHSLANNTTYYWKIVAHHPDGTITQSPVQKFKTKPLEGNETGSFVDGRDGQRYQWVALGSNKWMVHNLAYWPEAADGYTGYQYYYDVVSGNKEYFMLDHTTENLRKFGYLYNWTGAINDTDNKDITIPKQGVCPIGWHIPTYNEWNDAYLAAEGIAGDAAVANKTIYYDTWPIATGKENDWLNMTGLSVLPGGYKLGTTLYRGTIGQFWLADPGAFGGLTVQYNYNTLVVGSPLLITENSYNKTSGASSIRCVKNTIEPPQKPVLLAPTDAATGTAYAIKLQWSPGVDPNGDDVLYKVYLDTAAYPETLIADNLDANAYDIKELLQNTTYYWRVVIQNEHGLATESNTWSFTTKTNTTNTLPDVPQLLQPADQSTAVELTPILTWAPLTDPNGDVLTAELFVGVKKDSLRRVAGGISGTSYTITNPLLSATGYYWKIVAHDNNGGATSSETHRFSTGNRPPEAPVLLTPAMATQWTMLEQTFTWKPSADPDNDAVTYAVYAGNSVTTMSLYAVGLKDTYYGFGNLQVPLNTVFYWQVVATDGKGGETASAIANFKTYQFFDNTVTTLISPGRGATQVPLNPVLSWNANPNHKYDVYLDNGTGAALIAKDLTATTYTVTGLYGETQLKPHRGYGWYVVAKTTSGGVSVAEARGFTTRSAAPSKPVLIAPAHQAPGQPYTPVLTWSASTDDDGDRVLYDVVLGTASTPTLAIATNLLETTYTLPPNELKPNTVYYWKIIARDAFGGVAESDVRSFTTHNNAQNTPPSTPNLLTPAQYAAGVGQQPALTWTASKDTDNDPVTYDVYVATSTSFGAPVASGLSTASYTVIPQLAVHTKYYWKVVARDGKGGEAASAVWSFTTANNAPAPVTLISPANADVLTTATATLTWSSTTDPDGDPIVYDVYLDKSTQPATRIAQGLTALSFTTPPLDNNATYYWKIVTRDSYGAEAASDIYTVQGKNQAPVAAVLQSPANNSAVSVAAATLGWSPATDADGDALAYDIIFGETPNPVQKIATVYNSLSFGTPVLVQNKTYYWRVIVKDSHGAMAESPVWKFTYQPGATNQPPVPPVLLTPANQATGIGQSIILTWNASTDPEADAVTYNLYVSEEPTASVLRAADLVITSFQLTPLQSGTTWYWKVVAADDHGNTSASETWTFTTEAEQPEVYTINGTITDDKQTPLPGVELAGFPVTIHTDITGVYTAEVPAGWSGRIIPNAAERTFLPETREYVNVSHNYTDQNYEAQLISGVEQQERRILSVYPNPASGGTRITFSQPLTGNAWLVIVDARGQEIARQEVEQGSAVALWNGVDATGNTVNNGLYYIQLFTGKRLMAAAKLMVIK